jgi:hypothetical protein
MKTAAFFELLESVRQAGAYLKGNSRAVARTDLIAAQTVTVIRAKLKLGETKSQPLRR